MKKSNGIFYPGLRANSIITLISTCIAASIAVCTRIVEGTSKEALILFAGIFTGIAVYAIIINFVVVFKRENAIEKENDGH